MLANIANIACIFCIITYHFLANVGNFTMLFTNEC